MNIFKETKALPMELSNDLIAYKPFDACRASIMKAYNNSKPWIYEIFLNFKIIVYQDEENLELDCHFYEESPTISVKKIPRNLLDQNSFIEFCLDAIVKDYYVFAAVDTYEISLYKNYKLDHVPHHILISGFDLNDNTFIVSDFFDFYEGKYSVNKASFIEILNGYNAIHKYTNNDNNDGSQEWLRDIEILRVLREYKEKYSIQRLGISLKYFLEEKDSHGNKEYINNEYYGYALYDLAIKYFKTKN